MKKILINKNSKYLIDYAQFFDNLKKDILQTQFRVALSVSKELILLYWRIEKYLSEFKCKDKNEKTIHIISADFNLH